ncbi:MAG: DUF1003 domain-containing protein [Deltaproteobacteria bacterium]|nr:DUF1003 domain-containing protein [Deltaproteobacteria bacterium]
MVRPAIVSLIEKKVPQWSSEGFICVDDLNDYRVEYIRTILEAERGDLSAIDREVLESMKTQELLSTHIEDEFQASRTLGERLADRIATFGGSWIFIAIFMATVFFWMAINTTYVLLKPFDPFPYILLNLVLSCIAAIQAPIIMMSQNRQEARDRLRAAHDYQINLKAELEIRQLHQKIDHLLSHQWDRLIQIQEIQLEMMRELELQKHTTVRH